MDRETDRQIKRHPDKRETYTYIEISLHCKVALHSSRRHPENRETDTYLLEISLHCKIAMDSSRKACLKLIHIISLRYSYRNSRELLENTKTKKFGNAGFSFRVDKKHFENWVFSHEIYSNTNPKSSVVAAFFNFILRSVDGSLLMRFRVKTPVQYSSVP